MILLRSVLYQVLLFLFVIPYFFIVFASLGLPRKPRFRVVAVWPQVASWLAEHLLGIRYEVLGRENIPSYPVVILAKHQSAWETLTFTRIFPYSVYVLKRELFWVPFLGWGLMMMSPIAINRSARKAAMTQVAQQGAARLAQGFNILIFPEGTRTPVGSKGVYRRGGAVLAVDTGVPVLPVAHNAGTVWPRNSFLKRPGKVTVVIGPLIQTADRPPEDIMRDVEEWIEAEVARLIPGSRPSR